MQTTKLDLQIIKNDINSPVDISTLSNVIFIEDSDDLRIVSQITLSGKYNRVYNVVSNYISLDLDRVCLDNDTLIIALFDELAIIDLKQDKLARVVKLKDCWGIFNICKFKSGYFIHCEGVCYFLDNNFNILWESSSIDIFVNSKVENDFELHEDYIVVYDWYGHKYYYNENGVCKCEHYPQLNCSKD